MARTVPKNIPSKSTRGEQRLFALLAKLPDDCVVYYETKLGTLRPDFVVICPQLGVLIIEEKGWYSNQIASADADTVTLDKSGKFETVKHPLAQARDYMFEAKDQCRKADREGLIHHSTGAHQGRVVFPFGHIAVLSNISKAQMDRSNRAVDEVFPPAQTLFRDDLENLETLVPEALIAKMRTWFNPTWKFPPLNTDQVNLVRAAIHPEIRLSKFDRDLAVLDLEQERLASDIGSGHRIIYGIAGSGKTVLLIARAKLYESPSNRRILMLCYNKELAYYLAHELSEFNETVTVLHFHAWAGQLGVFDGHQGEFPDEAELGAMILNRLESERREGRHFDGILIDEAQDFDESWFRCAVEALRDPENGDLLIVSDGAQQLYKRRSFTWKSVGIKAQGRVLNTRKYGLLVNYRSTFEILKAAADFANANEPANQPSGEDSALQYYFVDPECAKRSGAAPKYWRAESRNEEIHGILRSVKGWLERGVVSANGELRPISPDEIAILFTRMLPRDHEHMTTLLNGLGELSNYRFVSSSKRYTPPESPNPNDPPITVSTIHSSKGLQWRAVIIMWADLLGSHQNTFDQDRALLYVGLTRAEDFLFVSSSGETVVTRQVEDAMSSAVATDCSPSLGHPVGGFSGFQAQAGGLAFSRFMSAFRTL